MAALPIPMPKERLVGKSY